MDALARARDDAEHADAHADAAAADAAFARVLSPDGEHGGVPISIRAKARSIHWSPYDRVGVVNAVS
jgi:hypothetical protein